MQSQRRELECVSHLTAQTGIVPALRPHCEAALPCPRVIELMLLDANV